ncbi:tetratricopeptide repeat protein [Blastopirellula sp. JC732]|uniref:Tetratricopeptide repeat protein n=1 Tax=Blastopirellula sediminis TaxID=2894196 RepID=A0A9X1MT15_9BACT|nr:tetratricopeptide repeat protein [Blastopirellula sediminis]MCC9604821.1 tetratricopeptide repeat protein [Blastopirellula sediminis]MCC9631880.1 tetratricopeptide repeat protein [Blastopirellula sediminis]
MPKKSPWIVDVTLENFEAEVLERSREVPVIVDFWAVWCQPCQLLMPILEKLAIEMDGKFRLAKANTEEVPQLAASFNVQGVPAVFAVRDGAIIDFFDGMRPEDFVRDWIKRQFPSEAEKLLYEVRNTLGIDPAEVEAKLLQAIELDPKLDVAKTMLAEHLYEQHRDDDAAKWIASLEERGFLEPEAAKVKAAIELRKLGAAAGGVDDCRAELAAAPDDPEKLMKLAEALAAAGQFQESLDTALAVVRKDRAGQGETARQLMVDIFRQLADDEELVNDYRRKLAAALY